MYIDIQGNEEVSERELLAKSGFLSYIFKTPPYFNE